MQRPSVARRVYCCLQYVALRYAIAKHGMKFPDQFRCGRHAGELRKKGFNVKKVNESDA